MAAEADGRPGNGQEAVPDVEDLPVADPHPDILHTPFKTFDSFLPEEEAVAMRQAVDRHFSEPHRHRTDSHFIWNYWYVPGIYTYLRAVPEQVIPRPRVAAFHAALTRWSAETIGLGHVTWPSLALYVDGCSQGIHNDSANGRLGYVYSLTRDDRNSRGGETIVFKEDDPFRSRLTRADAGIGLYDLIPPVFNRLVLFDDRMPHGVQRIEGSMDPIDGRLVLHGHISEAGPVVKGPLPIRLVEAARTEALKAALGQLPETGRFHHGPLTVRLDIAPHGQVTEARLLLDRVARSDGGSPEALVELILDLLGIARFPAANAGTIAILPILVGGPLPRAAG